MKITATFDSYEEFIAFANGTGEKQLIDAPTGGAQAPQEVPKKTEAKKSTPKKVEAVQAAEEAPWASEPTFTPGGGAADDSIVNPATGKNYEEEVKAEKVDESYRTRVRKTLASLNKKTGKNTASELIHTFGVEKLTEVALEDLPALMQKAEETLNA
nr:MAG TPA: hypothetical protein [Caudoviricetes sp.]